MNILEWVLNPYSVVRLERTIAILLLVQKKLLKSIEKSIAFFIWSCKVNECSIVWWCGDESADDGRYSSGCTCTVFPCSIVLLKRSASCTVIVVVVNTIKCAQIQINCIAVCVYLNTKAKQIYEISLCGMNNRAFNLLCCIAVRSGLISSFYFSWSSRWHRKNNKYNNPTTTKKN